MTNKEESIADRILLSFPSGQYCLPGLLRVLSIVESTAVNTACVECATRPNLYINPDFVQRHAETPEKLLMLVLHELHHVILGHTRLYQRVTPLDNLVFDAVINAMLCRLFPCYEYTSFFTEFYDDDDFPACFLRPADGWDPDGTGSPIPPALHDEAYSHLAELHEALYSETGVTYSELRIALAPHVEESQIDLKCLIGDHSEEGEGSSSDGQIENHAPILFDELRRIVERWPRPPIPIKGRSPHEMLEERTVLVPRRSDRSKLEWLLRRIGGDSRRGRLRKPSFESTPVMSPIPRADRRAIVLTALGSRTLLYEHGLPVKRHVKAGERVHVYLDVSGSIGDLVRPLYAAILRCQYLVHRVVHLFSTEVSDVTLAELRKGVCHTTFGTSIDCVADHIRENQVRRAVLVTDGFVGRPGAVDRETLRRARLGVAITPGGSSRDDLADLINEWTELGEIES